MSGPIPVIHDHDDLRVRVVREVFHAVENAATEFCMREGSVPAGVARQLFINAVVVSALGEFVIRRGVEQLPAWAAGLVREAVGAVGAGTLVPIDRSVLGR